jgi:hypothetical protein
MASTERGARLMAKSEKLVICGMKRLAEVKRMGAPG